MKLSPEWTDATLQNGWATYDTNPVPSSWGPAQFVKDADGWVHFRGLIKNGTTTSGTTIFTLPAGCRPGRFYLFGTLSTDLLCRLDVNPDGAVVCRSGVNAGWVSLTGISFLAEA